MTAIRFMERILSDMNDREQKELEERIHDTVSGLRDTVSRIINKCMNLQSELKNCRNELCLKCGNYREAHNGACDGCRYRKGGEWEDGLNE